MPKLIQTKSSFLSVKNEWLDEEECQKLITHIHTLPLIAEPKFIMSGRERTMHRKVGFFSDDTTGYFYTNQEIKSLPLTGELKEVMTRVNERYSSDNSFNGILINIYRDGNDSIGAHSDREVELSPGKYGVIALSLGASRTFRVRHRSLRKFTQEDIIEGYSSVPASGNYLDIETSNGQLLMMGGNFQKEFTHEIPVQKTITDERISLTFRSHQ